jgi:enoyl-CoA hydratase
MGVFSQVFPAETLAAEVAQIAARVAATAPVAAKLTKQALVGGGHDSFETALRWEALAQPITLATEDLQEGLAAQRERRAARFAGR